jgi:GxxExxY protein
VLYEGEIVGEYFADIKAAKNIAEEHEAQLLNYLKATDIEVGLLLNYGPKPNFKRKAFDNTRK